jgi:hypothetical protein
MKSIRSPLKSLMFVVCLLPATIGCSVVTDAVRAGLTPDPSACDFPVGRTTRQQIEATWGSPVGWTRDQQGKLSFRYRKGFAQATAVFSAAGSLEALSCERKG